MLLLFPSVAKQKKEKMIFQDDMQIYLRDVRLGCYEVFQENNVKKRTAFFSEPLIKYLWTLFSAFKPEFIMHHLKKTRSQPNQGELRYRVLIADIHSFESKFNFKIIPDVARNDSAITFLTKEELEIDIEANGKFNRHQAGAMR